MGHTDSIGIFLQLLFGLLSVTVATARGYIK